jgi:hypothetical protein
MQSVKQEAKARGQVGARSSDGDRDDGGSDKRRSGFPLASPARTPSALRSVTRDPGSRWGKLATAIRVKARRHGKAAVLREIVLAHCPRRRLKPFAELYRDVLDDYGSVPCRTVYRAIGRLIRAGHIVRVQDPELGSHVSGYVVAASPLLRDAEGVELLLESLAGLAV